MKRIIIFCDGTWQKLKSKYPTNVVKLLQSVEPVTNNGVQQIVYYDEGVGTESKLNKIFGGAFGWGLDKNIKDAYKFISLNYCKGDELYLFGFSRGAYTVRSLAGLIYNSGLVKREYIRKIPDAFDLYSSKKIHPDDSKSKDFRAKYGKRVDINLLGCWDTVGSLGIPDQIPFLPIDKLINKKYKFHDTKLSNIVKNAFHAVAIDERRKVFNVTEMTKARSASRITLKQVWFCGIHGCVGGGNEKNSDLSDITLEWLIEEIRKSRELKLELNENKIQYKIKPMYTQSFDNKVTGIYWFTGKIYRKISGEFEDIHKSVKKRWKNDESYRPPNLKNKYRNKLNSWIEKK